MTPAVHRRSLLLLLAMVALAAGAVALAWWVRP